MENIQNYQNQDIVKKINGKFKPLKLFLPSYLQFVPSRHALTRSFI